MREAGIAALPRPKEEQRKEVHSTLDGNTIMWALRHAFAGARRLVKLPCMGIPKRDSAADYG